MIIETRNTEDLGMDNQAGMVFIMTNSNQPILAQMDRECFMDAVKNKFIVFEKAAFIESWDCTNGRFVSDKAGWIDDLLISTSIIKWVRFY